MLRAASARIDPGGKGVNVTRVLRAYDVGSHAVIPCAGPDGEELVRLLQKAGVPGDRGPGRGLDPVEHHAGRGRRPRPRRSTPPAGALTAAEVALLAETVVDRCVSQGS